MANVTIVGLGLIGTSIGQGLRKARHGGVKIIGYDRETKNTRAAKSAGGIDSVENILTKAVEKADIVFVATPVLAMREVFETIAPHLPRNCIVTDTGSTKQQVLKWAEELFPDHVNFIGGHPMAGSEKSGPEAGKADLFKDATYCLLPGRNASTQALETLVAFVKDLGARPHYIEPFEHDTLVAGVSHLPLALSAALVSTTSQSPSWPELAMLAAGGYRDVSRLASGDPGMSVSICLTNASEIAGWVDRFIAQLETFKTQLKAQDREALVRLFSDAFSERERWLAGVAQRPGARDVVELPNAMETAYRTMFGDAIYSRTKKLMEMSENPFPKKGGGGAAKPADPKSGKPS